MKQVFMFVLNILSHYLLGTNRPEGWVRTDQKWVRNVWAWVQIVWVQKIHGYKTTGKRLGRLRQTEFSVIVNNSSPPPTVYQLLANSLPKIADTKLTGHRQVTKRLATDSEITLLVHFCTQKSM